MVFSMPQWVQCISDWVHARTGRDCYLQACTLFLLSASVCSLLCLISIISGNTFLISDNGLAMYVNGICSGFLTGALFNSFNKHAQIKPSLKEFDKVVTSDWLFFFCISVWTVVFTAKCFLGQKLEMQDTIIIGLLLLRAGFSFRTKHKEHEDSFNSGAFAALKPTNPMILMSLGSSAIISVAVLSNIIVDRIAGLDLNLQYIVLFVASFTAMLACSAAACRPRPPGYAVRRKVSISRQAMASAGA